MAGPVELEQARAGDAVGDEAGVVDRDQPVLAAVYDERGRLDLIKPAVAVVEGSAHIWAGRPAGGTDG